MMGWWDNMWCTQIKKGESWARVGLANHRKPEFLHSRGFLQLFAVGDMGNQWKSSTFQRFEMISLGGEIHKHQAAIRGNWWQSISNMLQLSGSFSRVQVGYPTFLTFMGNCSSLVASNQDKVYQARTLVSHARAAAVNHGLRWSGENMVKWNMVLVEDSVCQWIGLFGKNTEKPWFLPLNMGFSCKNSPQPIHWVWAPLYLAFPRKMGMPECHKTNNFNTTQLLLQSNFECFEGTPKSKTRHMNTYTSTFTFPNHSLIISRWLNSVVLASCTLWQFNVAMEHSIFYEANEHKSSTSMGHLYPFIP